MIFLTLYGNTKFIQSLKDIVIIGVKKNKCQCVLNIPKYYRNIGKTQRSFFKFKFIQCQKIFDK